MSEKIRNYSPTAAFRLLVSTIKPATTIMLRAQTIILAILPMLPSVPDLGIPHSGFTPTGAECESTDKPVNAEEPCRSI